MASANLGDTDKFSPNFTTQDCLCQFQKPCQILYCTMEGFERVPHQLHQQSALTSAIFIQHSLLHS